MYQDVQGSPRVGFPPLAEGWTPIRAIQAIEAAVTRLYRAYEDWREQQAAIRDLQRLDDHRLRDLGIERFDISAVVARKAAANRR